MIFSLITLPLLLICIVTVAYGISVYMNTPQKHRTSPKDLFMHFLAMFTLYISAISLTVLLFNLIDLYFPDVADDQYWYGVGSRYEAAIRGALSFLVVMFPVCLITLRRVQQMYAKHQEKAKAGIRKIIAYFTLFVTTFIFLFTAVMTINEFLDGEITTRFILKIISAVAILGTVYWYYRWDLDAYKKLTGDHE